MAALTAAEEERSTQAIQIGQGYTQAALQLISQLGPAARARLVQHTQLLLQLLDGFVMPADLIGSAEDLRTAVERSKSSGSVTMASVGTAETVRYAPCSCKHLDPVSALRSH